MWKDGECYKRVKFLEMKGLSEEKREKFSNNYIFVVITFFLVEKIWWKKKFSCPTRLFNRSVWLVFMACIRFDFYHISSIIDSGLNY